MSLPDGFLDELRSRLSLAQVVGRKVAWDMRRSSQTKGDYWAPCPFHQEKTASFHVDDKNGFYYCFGCGAKGDAISFVRETENVGFVEAVEILAREVGVPLPERDPAARAKDDLRTELVEVVEAAVRHYQMQLRSAAGGTARDYLARRGLSQEAHERWEIGFAPEGWRGLSQALKAKGVSEERLIEAGLAARPERGGEPYDLFRGRVIFPIRDARGRAVGLGGRALDPAELAKYINSPQTALFDKGATVYNHARAREAARRGQRLVVAEGYMDVIALSEAGFGAAVAPLGTAVTETQLRLLWRIDPEPIVALDGDPAGLKAAHRLIYLALPLLGSDRSLRFCILPEKQDPDDVIRAGGSAAMSRLLDAAEPAVALMWRRAIEGRTFDSPERRAALDRELAASLKKIADPVLQSHYRDEIKRRRWDLLNPRRSGPRKPAWRPQSRIERQQQAEATRFGQAAAPQAARSALANAGDEVTEAMREAVILATLMSHPSLVARFEGDLESTEFEGPGHAEIQRALLAADPEAEDVRAMLVATLGETPLERLMTMSHVRISPGVRTKDPGVASMCVAEELAKLSARRGARRDIEEALKVADCMNEHVLWRVGRAAEVLSGLQRGSNAREDYETGANGAPVRSEERRALDDLIGAIDFSGGGRGRR